MDRDPPEIPERPTIGLIDGDILAYQAAAAVEYECHWDGDLWTLHANEAEAISALEETLETIRTRLGLTHFRIALSGPMNWRKLVMPTYKANRKNKRKPIVYPRLLEHLRQHHEVFEFPTLEGDDVLGLAQGSATVIVSLDKDLRTIPGHYCRWDGTDTAEIAYIPERLADYWHLTQTLTGDATDGYPGCPGIGEKTAAKLLDRMLETTADEWPVRVIWNEVIVPTYAKKGLGVEVALQNARVARILRRGEYDFQTEGVKLWQP